MHRWYIGIPSAMAVGSLVFLNMAKAQDTVQAPAHLNFEQFSKIVDADEVGFFTTLKWAGMKLVNSRVANRVVSLYDYEAKSLLHGTCSESSYSDNHALLVNWAVAAGEAITALEEVNLGLQSQKLEAEFSDREWVPVDGLMKFFSSYDIDEEIWRKNIPEPEPVWYEKAFVNSCQLQEFVANLHYAGLVWQPVFDEKLRAIAKNSAVNASDYDRALAASVIVTEPIMGSGEHVQYFAECGDTALGRDSLAVPTTSLCNTMLN